MWTIENRDLYDRSQLRYPSDLTDEEWMLVEPTIPPAKRGGGKRTVTTYGCRSFSGARIPVASASFSHI
jgi:hypothetical protein